MKKLVLMAIAVIAAVKYTERGQRAKNLYIEKVSSGSKPIEAVATAIAAFVGPAPDPTPPPPSPQPPRRP